MVGDVGRGARSRQRWYFLLVDPGDDIGPQADGGQVSPPQPPRSLRNLLAVGLVILGLIGFNGVLSPTRASERRLQEVVSDRQPDSSRSATLRPAIAPVPVATADAGSVPGTSTTAVSPEAEVAGSGMPTIESIEVAGVEPTGPAEPTTAEPPAIEAEILDPAIVGRMIPPETVAAPPAGRSPWADRSTTTSTGVVTTDVGCAAGTSGGALDAFFAARIGPVLGHDYQHVYPLGDGRLLWLFQDTFIDYSGIATELGQAAFAHNTAMVQDGSCFIVVRSMLPSRSRTAPARSGSPSGSGQWVVKPSTESCTSSGPR